MAGSVGKDIITDGLVFYMDFANKRCYNGDGSGNTTASGLIDSSLGTFINTSTIFDNSNAGFVTFDGTNDYFNTDFKGEGGYANPPFTVEIWFKTTNDNQRCGLFSNWIGASNSYRQFSIFIAGNHGYSVSGNLLGCYVRSSTGTRQFCLSTFSVCDGKWHQCVLVSTISSNNNLYIDGAFVDASSNAGSSTISMTESTTFTIGSIGSAVLPFDGSISNVKYYNKVLSADEVLQNYNALKDRFV